MKNNKFSRTEMLIGKDGMKKLKNAKIIVFGLGGVGSFVCEGLVRSGVENFILVDYDKIDETNINRQIIATRKTIGKNKVNIMKERILDINPDAKVEIHNEFYLNDSKLNIIKKDITYVIDCVDTIMTKIAIICKSKEINVPIISCMGTGNKLNPTMFEIDDIYNTSHCPLAKIIKKDLKKRNIKNLKVLYSKEPPINTNNYELNQNNKKHKIKGSTAFMPPVAGLIIAGEVIKNIITL